MPYNYEYLSVEKQISYLQQQIENKELRIFELELADQDDPQIIQDLSDVEDDITALKAKLTELEE
jgi:hypothetical protein